MPRSARKARPCGLLVLLTTLSWLLTAAQGAWAQTCSVTMPAAAFGTVDVLPGGAINTTTTLTVTCAGGGSGGQRVCINLGVGSAGDATSRQMTGASGTTLRYDFFTDAARSNRWGSWQTGYQMGGVQIDTGSDTSVPITVYGRIYASQQTVRTGPYSASFAAEPYIQYGKSFSSNCPTGGKTASSSTSVTATVASNCNISATNLNFGSRSLLTSNVDSTSTILAQCNNLLAYTISLDGGLSDAVDPTQRKMSSGGNQITYGLYRDAARTMPWGNTSGTNTLGGTGNGASQNIVVYGRVPPQSSVPPASYQDTIVVTVIY